MDMKRNAHELGDMNHKTKEYCLYLRKSRADAEAESRGEGETLARHEKALLELSSRLQLNVTEIYREIVSGETIASRPVMQKLLSEVEQGLWGGILVMEVERLARGDTIDQGIVAQAFKCSNTRIITPLKTYDPNNEYDEEYFEFGLFMSRREYKTINRRLQRGRITSVKEGKYVSNKAPYGYERVKLANEKGWTLEPMPDEADTIRFIFSLYTTGEATSDGDFKRLGVSLIARRLNMLKVPTKTGGAWVSSTIRDILINPVYIGKIRWNWRPAVKKIVDGNVFLERPRASADECILVQGRHPAIVREETFQMAQEIISKNSQRPIGERYMVKNPLAGLVVCGKCGRRMIRRPYSGKKTADTLMCAEPTCDNVSCALHCVEERVLSGLGEWLHEYRLEWGSGSNNITSQMEYKRKAAKRLEEEITTIGRQLDNIHDLLEQSVYTAETFLERTRVLNERIQVAKKELSEIESEIAAEKAREVGRRNIIPKVEHLLAVYRELPDAKAKNDMLKGVLEKAFYSKTHRARWHGSPDDFELTLYPRLPTV
jgi:site-specific DNA recombinase